MSMPFTLPDLPFDPNSMSPWTSTETFSYHHGKHHAGYVKKLNAAIEGTEMTNKSLEEVIKLSRPANEAVFNSAAQHYNHSFFWNCLTPDSKPAFGKIAQLINRDFGSFAEFKKQFSDLAGKHFGSGWVWLLNTSEGKLLVKDFHDADTPADSSNRPLLTLDVWEHAYYLDHQNNRTAFIDGFFDHVNWGFVNNQI